VRSLSLSLSLQKELTLFDDLFEWHSLIDGSQSTFRGFSPSDNQKKQ